MPITGAETALFLLGVLYGAEKNALCEPHVRLSVPVSAMRSLSDFHGIRFFSEHSVCLFHRHGR